MTPHIPGLHHDHIDGSAAMEEIILDLYRDAEKPFPFPTVDAWREEFRNPHADIVKCFSTVTSVLQTEEALTLAGYTYGKRRAREGYRYVEARFAPQYHTLRGLSLTDATRAMCQGLWQAQSEGGIRILPVLSINREADAATGVAIAEVALDYGGEVALDLACDEASHPPEKHLEAFEVTYGTKVKRTCHAGEWVSKEPAGTYRARLLENVRTAVRVLHADGIGHAIPLCDDSELIKEIVDNGIRVEGCPLSNLVCGGIKDLRELRLDELIDRGVIYTLNADDDLFLPPMCDVIHACEEAYGFTSAEWRKLQGNVWRGAFARDAH